MATNRKKIIKKIIIIVLIIVIVANIVMTKSIHLSKEGVEKIFVAVTINTNELIFDGKATVTKECDVEEVVKTLNRIKAFRFGKHSVDDLEGDSPTAWVMLYDKEGEIIDSINFYQNIISCNGGKFYYMSMSEYDKLLRICNGYDDKLLPDSPKYLSAEDIKNIMRETDSEVKEINSRLDNEFYKDYYDRDILRFRYFSCGVEQESLSIYRLYYDQQGKLIYADIAHYRGALYSIYFYGDELLHVETGSFAEGGLFINGGMENVRDVIEKEPGYAFVLKDSSLCLEHAYK